MKKSAARRIRWTVITEKMPKYCGPESPAYYFGKNWRTKPTLYRWRAYRDGRRMVVSLGSFAISTYKDWCYARRQGRCD